MKISRTRIIRVFNLIPLILGLGLIPLMVQVRKITTLPIERIAWRDIDWYVDFFARSKFEVLLLAAIIAAVLSLYHMRTHTDQVLYKYYMLLFAFMVLVVISTLSERYIPYLGQNFSAVSYNVDYVMTETSWNIGFWGFPERYEGLLAMVSYFALFILSIKVLREEIDYKILVIVMAISSAIIGLIGLTQFVGMDLFRTDFGRFLIRLTGRDVDISATEYTVKDKVIYSTLYNPNYVGSYI
ncbi:MAG: hypothetical protein PF505_08690, partial [Vallitaleaceae bacterium]|nr:hypothetical protein [Vallitaleaceae bacterium]